MEWGKFRVGRGSLGWGGESLGRSGVSLRWVGVGVP